MIKYAALLLVALAMPALGQTATALSGSSAQSASGSLSAASGNANQQSINFYPAAVPASTFNENKQSGTVRIENVPQVYAPPMGVTAPCRVALSGGVSVVGVGAALGGSVPDTPCNLRELSRTYHALGANDKAVKVADGALALECEDREVARALGNLCPSREPVVQPQPLPTQATAGGICDTARRTNDQALAARNGCPL
jgi:hypothetical protein